MIRNDEELEVVRQQLSRAERILLERQLERLASGNSATDSDDIEEDRFVLRG